MLLESRDCFRTTYAFVEELCERGSNSTASTLTQSLMAYERRQIHTFLPPLLPLSVERRISPAAAANAAAADAA
jgi:hypothetical protein